jgi:hypothetical protein
MKHIKASRLGHLFLAVSMMALFAGCGGGGGGGGNGGGSDTTAPVPPGTAPSFTDITASGLTVSWDAAHDTVTDQGDLRYRLYFSDQNNITTVEDAQTNGTPAMGWSAGTTTHGVSGLDDATDYYFSVLVEDEAGNIAIYTSSHAETLDATPPNPVGIISYSGTTSYSTTASWEAANDNVTASGSLLYHLYYSNTNNMTSVDEIITNHHGTAIGGWQTQTSSIINKLLGNTMYWFAVIVKDEAGNMALYEQKSVTTGAPTWKGQDAAGFSTGQIFYTSLKIDQDGDAYIAYSDAGNGDRLTVQGLDWDSDTWGTIGSFTEAIPEPGGFALNYVSLALDSSGVPYVAFPDYDADADNYKLTVKKYNGASWDLVGTRRFSSGRPRYVSLSIDGTTPYAAFQDDEKGNNLVVMKYTGSGASGWEYVGPSAGLTENSAIYISLCIDSSHVPYVAYMDGDNGAKATVRVFNSVANDWDPVGTAGFSTGLAYDVSLCLDGDGVPYVVYEDASLAYQAVARKYTGSGVTGWAAVDADSEPSTGEATWCSLDIDANNVPYVAYRDGDNSDKLTVKKFNGTSWVLVGGSAGISAGAVDYVSLCLDQLGNPVVGYSDANSAGKATVLKFY